jgi:glutamine synthetase
MLPQSLEAATIRMMRQGSVAREVLGDDFVEHFGGTREHEVSLWNSAVTNWEGEPQTDSSRCRSVANWIRGLVERYLELA